MKIATVLTTPVQFWYKTSVYVPGEGETITWTQFLSDTLDTFWCEWRGTYGDQRFSAQAQGVSDSARVRMAFIPALYEKLRTVGCLVVKNADASAIVSGEPVISNPNVYQLWGGVDNVQEQNQWMEFLIKRYEAT